MQIEDDLEDLTDGIEREKKRRTLIEAKYEEV
jgi:hypothetical protein